MTAKPSGWIGVDLDGTLAVYDGWKGPNFIGAPIAPMVNRVKEWLAQGRQVKIMTARVGPRKTSKDPFDTAAQQTYIIKRWCKTHLGQELEVTATKDFGMEVLYDDRAIQVEPNTGRLIGSPFEHAETLPK